MKFGATGTPTPICLYLRYPKQTTLKYIFHTSTFQRAISNVDADRLTMQTSGLTESAYQ